MSTLLTYAAIAYFGFGVLMLFWIMGTDYQAQRDIEAMGWHEKLVSFLLVGICWPFFLFRAE